MLKSWKHDSYTPLSENHFHLNSKLLRIRKRFAGQLFHLRSQSTEMSDVEAKGRFQADFPNILEKV